jgi:hypothetical protein
LRWHTQRGSGPLDQGTQTKSPTVKEQRYPDHTLVSDEADLEIRVSIHRQGQGEETSGWKINVPNAILGFYQYVGKFKFNGLASG